MPDDRQSSFSPGKVIAGRFRIDRLIGRGGMGEVYAAKNVATGRDVALKMIRGAADAEQTRRFLREAKAATAIQHPNVIEVLDVFEDEDHTPVMVMELLRGEPFSALRKRKGALALHEVARVLMPVAAALRAAHEKRIVHRDLKPDNIFLSEPPGGGGCVPKVLDFGIAKVLDPTSISSETQGGNTSTGSILGTPHYMSFEQAMSEKDIDHRADIWAMGVMLFEALTGRRPLEFENLGEMYTAFLQGDVPSIRATVPDLPADVGEVIERCLQKKREGRLEDLGPLIEVLGRYTDPAAPGPLAGGKVVSALGPPAAATLPAPSTLPTSAAAQTSPSAQAPDAGRARWAKLAPAAAALLAIGGLTAFFVFRSPPDQANSPGVVASADRPPAPSATAATSVTITAGTAAPAPQDSVIASAAPSVAPSAKTALKPSLGPAKSPAPSATPSANAAAATAAPSQTAKGIISTTPY